MPETKKCLLCWIVFLSVFFFVIFTALTNTNYSRDSILPKRNIRLKHNDVGLHYYKTFKNVIFYFTNATKKVIYNFFSVEYQRNLLFIESQKVLAQDRQIVLHDYLGEIEHYFFIILTPQRTADKQAIVYNETSNSQTTNPIIHLDDYRNAQYSAISILLFITLINLIYSHSCSQDRVVRRSHSVSAGLFLTVSPKVPHFVASPEFPRLLLYHRIQHLKPKYCRRLYHHLRSAPLNLDYIDRDDLYQLFAFTVFQFQLLHQIGFKPKSSPHPTNKHFRNLSNGNQAILDGFHVSSQKKRLRCVNELAYNSSSDDTCAVTVPGLSFRCRVRFVSSKPVRGLADYVSDTVRRRLRDELTSRSDTQRHRAAGAVLDAALRSRRVWSATARQMSGMCASRLHTCGRSAGEVHVEQRLADEVGGAKSGRGPVRATHTDIETETLEEMQRFLRTVQPSMIDARDVMKTPPPWARRPVTSQVAPPGVDRWSPAGAHVDGADVNNLTSGQLLDMKRQSDTQYASLINQKLTSRRIEEMITTTNDHYDNDNDYDNDYDNYNNACADKHFDPKIIETDLVRIVSESPVYTVNNDVITAGKVDDDKVKCDKRKVAGDNYLSINKYCDTLADDILRSVRRKCLLRFLDEENSRADTNKRERSIAKQEDQYSVFNKYKIKESFKKRLKDRTNHERSREQWKLRPTFLDLLAHEPTSTTEAIKYLKNHLNSALVESTQNCVAVSQISERIKNKERELSNGQTLKRTTSYRVLEKDKALMSDNKLHRNQSTVNSMDSDSSGSFYSCTYDETENDADMNRINDDDLHSYYEQDPDLLSEFDLLGISFLIRHFLDAL